MNKGYWIKRLREPSTWRGLCLLATGLGVAISPETMEAIIAVGTGVAGLIGVVTKDHKETGDGE